MRSTSTVSSRKLLLLAPTLHAVPESFTQVQPDARAHEDLLAETQRFRGQIYLQDGAIKPSQLIHGRHCLDVDQGSWHLLVLDPGGSVCGCARFKQYPSSAQYGDLTVSRSALARSREWGEFLRAAVESELAQTQRLDLSPSEWGGWALDEEVRGTAEALRMTLAAYALTEELGGGAPYSYVTRRHGSASILRRMGGCPLEFRGIELPAYYDPQYECEMEVLRFRSWEPNPRYRIWIDEVRSTLRSTPVLAAGAPEPRWRSEYRSGTATRATARAVAAG
jgi:hypothetical protein